MTIAAGTHLGDYEVIAPLGAGGMGEVYRAHDHSLDREVALKVLPLDLAADDQRRAWLMREARAAATLNHPNICTVHAVGESAGQIYLAMELVDGRPLSALIADGPLPLDDVVHHGVQLAAAVGHAHDHHIVHRDLKSANAMLTRDGRIKVVDFGLAKRTTGDEPSDIVTRTPETLTAPGAIVGTVPYMAPEQLRGEAADARSDVWALGVILYEMSAGVRPFEGQSGFELASAILNDRPAPPAKVPAALGSVILRCLEKEPARRYQRAGELRAALETLSYGVPSRREPRLGLGVPTRQIASVAVPLLLAGAAFAAWRSWPEPRTAEAQRAVALTTLPGQERYPTLSPDGTHVAFAWGGDKFDNVDIYVHLIGSSGPPLRLTTDARADTNPVWSPDGRWIAFLREDTSGRYELRLVAPLGGTERRLAEARITGLYSDAALLTWCPDSTCLVLADAAGREGPDALFAVSLETGEKRQLTRPQPPAIGDVSPAVSPDGRTLLFSRLTATFVPALYWMPLGDALVATGDPRVVPIDGMLASYPVWLPDGEEALFSARGHLWRKVIRGDAPPVRLPFVGDDGVMPVVSRLERAGGSRLVYVRRTGGDAGVALASGDTNIWRVDLPALGVPATSAPAVAIASTRWDGNPQISPDGTQVAFCSGRSGSLEIWLSELDGSRAIQLTDVGKGTTCSPRWSPRGDAIAFDSTVEGQQEIYVIAASGGKPTRLTSGAAVDAVPSFSRDGRWIYFYSNRTGANQVWRVPATGGAPEQITKSGGYVAFESADGAYLYYTRSSTLSELWRVPTLGGEPVKVLDQVRQRAFAIVEKGIYFVDGAASETRLRFFDFATGRTSVVARNLGETSFGLTATPDGRIILYSKVDLGGEDLMLVDNFR
jgi:Tol biopolymer transport system component